MPILGLLASAISGNLFAPSGAYDSIATVTIGSPAASSITFSSIPATYKHLQIRGITRNSANVGTDDVQLRINADSGNNYTFHELYGQGSSAAIYAGVADNYMRISRSVADASFSANIFNALVVDILDYANTSKYKTVRTLYGTDGNGSGAVGLSSGLWISTSAITSLTIYPYHVGSNNYAQYSSLALYGIKGA